MRKQMSGICHQEMETLGAKLRTFHDDDQAQMKQHFKAETKALKEDLARISLENQALQGQFAEVLQLLRSKAHTGIIL